MVLWTLYAVILFLCGSNCAKTENDLRRLSLSPMDVLRKGYSSLPDGDAAACRYSKLLAVLRKNFHLDAEAISFDNVKDKKKRGAGLIEDFAESDCFDEGTQDKTSQSDAEIGSESFLNFDDLDFLKDEEIKRGTSTPNVGCDCKIKNDLLDLGHLHYPRYLLNAVCQKDDDTFESSPKCWRGAECKPLEYKVRVLTYRSHNDHLQKDPAMALLPDVLRSFWKFKTVTVAAGCFCS